MSQSPIVPHSSLFAFCHSDSFTGPRVLSCHLLAVHSPLHSMHPPHHQTVVHWDVWLSSTLCPGYGESGTLSQNPSLPKSTMVAFLLCPPPQSCRTYGHRAMGQAHRWLTRSSAGKQAVVPLSFGGPKPLSGNPRDLTRI